MDLPLISVIVPIYNVERYVRKCLESLKGQTIREIEVICIDDGSTDGSGRIADEYESQDWPKFRIVHTENRGLSAARNRGINEAASDWLMFVDSDDWVEPDFCRIPYEAAMKYGADMVIFSNWRASESEKVEREKKTKVRLGIVDSEDVILNSVAWNKLYAKDLFKDVYYPEGHTFEDIATTCKLIHKANRIFRCEEKLYFYRKRKDSITKTPSNYSDAYYAGKLQYQELLTMGYSKNTANSCLFGAALNYCGHASSMCEPLYCEAEAIVEAIEDIPEGFNRKSIVKLKAWRMSKRLYRLVYRIIGRQIKSL